MNNPNPISFADAPSDPAHFFPWLKERSELYWLSIKINHYVHGFQIQPGTKWNKGLTNNEIIAYEQEMGFKFPFIFKLFLKHMNGNDTETVNVYADCGEPFRYGIGYYAFPKDLAKIKDMINWIYEENKLSVQEIEKKEIPHILPLIGHRFLVIDRCPSNPVLSMYGNDIISYANNLLSFLYYDVFHNSGIDPELDSNLKVDFWL